MARVRPSFHHEAPLWAAGQLVVGVDEVGRGALAGPVVAAACLLPPWVTLPVDVFDSKQMTRPQRERAFHVIRQCGIVAVGAASHREIDRYDIRRATAVAMWRALQRLPHWDVLLYDGLPMHEFSQPGMHALVDGDQRCLSIACAAIVAKVIRDDLMARLARRYPVYGWDENAGYGTARHRQALEQYGPSPFHRRSFAPIATLVAQVPSLTVGERRR